MRDKSPETYQRLINCLQGKTTRWIEGESPATGLYTGGVLTCKIFVLFGKNSDGKKVISMTHLDEYTNLSVLDEEFDWVKTIIYCRIIVKSEIDVSAITSKFQTAQKIEIPFLRDAVVVYYDTDQKVKIDIIASSQLEALKIVLLNHPDAASLYSYYMINAALSFLQRGLKLGNGDSFLHQKIIFDGNGFSKLMPHDLAYSDFVSKCQDLRLDLLSHAISINKIECYPKFSKKITSIIYNSLIAPNTKKENGPFKETAFEILLSLDSIWISFAYLLNLTQLIPDQLRSIFTDELNNVYQRNMERRFLLCGLKPTGILIYGESRFFSRSQFATRQQPFGPYADRFCSDNGDLETQVCQALGQQ